MSKQEPAVRRSTRSRRGWIRIARTYLRSTELAKPEEFLTVRRRLIEHWPVLEDHVWKPLLQHEEELIDRRPDLYLWGARAGSVAALVLECAVNWALESSTATSVVREAVQTCASLDAKISRVAGELVKLIQERRSLETRHGLSTESGGPNLDLWELIENAAAASPEWAICCAKERKSFLRVASEMSRPGPELEDVLAGIAATKPTVLAAHRGGDSIALRPSPGSSDKARAAKIRRFLDKLRRVSHIGGLVDASVGPLYWMEPKAVSTLLAVVSQGRVEAEGPYNSEEVQKVRTAYLGDPEL